MKKQLLCAVTVLASFFLGDAVASAHNLLTDLRLQIHRYARGGATYGCHSHLGHPHQFHCHDCLMPWQPIRSTMHRSVLPPSMRHPPPLHVPHPWLAPPTPNWSPTGSNHDPLVAVCPDYGPPGVLAADGRAAPVAPYVFAPPDLPPYAMPGYAPPHILERGPGVGVARP